MGRKKVLLKGIGASLGEYKGRVKIVFSPEEASKKIKKGDILVTSLTEPSFVPIMKKAGAIVTNTGGVLSHAAIVSRELGIPCVVGTRKATEVLKDEMEVFVNGLKGLIYKV
jgi:pyruvate,water dikinase